MLHLDLERISDEIKLQGLSQQAFAKRVGITGQWLSKILLGDGCPSAPVLKRISRQLGIDVRELAKNGKQRKSA